MPAQTKERTEVQAQGQAKAQQDRQKEERKDRLSQFYRTFPATSGGPKSRVKMIFKWLRLSSQNYLSVMPATNTTAIIFCSETKSSFEMPQLGIS